MKTHIFSGNAQLPGGTNLAFNHKLASVILEIDMDNGQIVDCSVPIYCDLHSDVISEIVCGKSIENDFPGIIDEINERVHSISTKSLITSLQVVYNRYILVRENMKEKVNSKLTS